MYVEFLIYFLTSFTFAMWIFWLWLISKMWWTGGGVILPCLLVTNKPPPLVLSGTVFFHFGDMAMMSLWLWIGKYLKFYHSTYLKVTQMILNSGMCIGEQNSYYLYFLNNILHYDVYSLLKHHCFTCIITYSWTYTNLMNRAL